MSCIKGAVDGGSDWSFEPKSDDSVDTSKRSSDSRRVTRSTIAKTSPLSSAVESIPVADQEGRIFALSLEPEFPSASTYHSSTGKSIRGSLRRHSKETFTDAEPSGSGHQTQDAVLKDLLASTNLMQRASKAKALDGVTKRSTAPRSKLITKRK